MEETRGELLRIPLRRIENDFGAAEIRYRQRTWLIC